MAGLTLTHMCLHFPLIITHQMVLIFTSLKSISGLSEPSQESNLGGEFTAQWGH